jgi:two-component system response regulator DctR
MNGATVHIVDDDEAVRDALAFLLKGHGLVAMTYESAEDFLADATLQAKGVILLDVRMGGMSGLELFDQLRAAQSRTPVIFLTGHADVPIAVGAIKSGAFDFLEKPCDDAALVALVERALQENARRCKRAEVTLAHQERLASLSAREKEVMELIAQGAPNKTIAHQLDIAVRTVEVHRARVFEKMGVRTAAELATLLATHDG